MLKHEKIFKEIAKDFSKNKEISGILLMDSVACGCASENSDLDIMVLGNENKFEVKYIDNIMVEIIYSNNLLEGKLKMNYIKYLRDKVGHDAINLTGVNVLIINDKNEILLQKRGTYPFKWGLIGGITELGESLEETAIREAKEETGLDIKDLSLFGTTSGKGCYMHLPNGDEAYFITIGYIAKNFSGELEIDDLETKELKFFQYEDLPDNIPNSHRMFLDKYYINATI